MGLKEYTNIINIINKYQILDCREERVTHSTADSKNSWLLAHLDAVQVPFFCHLVKHLLPYWVVAVERRGWGWRRGELGQPTSVYIKAGHPIENNCFERQLWVVWFGHPIKEMCPGSFRPLHATECFNYLLVKPLKDRVLAFKSGARAFNLSWPKNGSVSIGGSCV